MPPASKPGGEARLAIGAGVSAYVLWGLMPLIFQVVARQGVTSWEILAHRTIWAVPVSLILVLAARQWRQALAIARQPRVLAMLALSAFLIAINWAVFIWAVNAGRVLETSLGYYINPLLNMAAGALIFRERVSRLGWAAVALAAVGVAIQAVALGHLPFVSLFLGVSFCGYGVVRKRVAADAQTGLFIECLFLAVPSAVYVAWLQAHGQSHALDNPWALIGLMACGPITAIPLMLFAWATRRAPLSVMGFLLFITPTISFTIGVLQGEAFTPARALSFVFIWLGVAMFAWTAWRNSRAAARAVADCETP